MIWLVSAAGRRAQGDGGGGAAERRGAAAAGHHGGDGPAARRAPEPVRPPAGRQRGGQLRGGLPALVPAGADRPVERAAAPAVDCPSIVSIDLGNAEFTERRETLIGSVNGLRVFGCCHLTQSNSTLSIVTSELPCEGS